MTYIPPALVISAFVSSVTVAATWTTVDSTGFTGSPYKWTIILQITPQPTSYALSQTPYAYTGLDVVVGDWFSNAVGGFAWRINSISAQTATSVTCVVEDVNRFNTLSDAGNQGDGSPAALSRGFVFQLSPSGMPILSPVIENVITSQWQTDIQGRFLLTNPLATVAASGSASDLTTGILPSAQIPIGTSTTVGGVKPDGTTIANNAGLISVIPGATMAAWAATLTSCADPDAANLTHGSWYLQDGVFLCWYA